MKIRNIEIVRTLLVRDSNSHYRKQALTSPGDAVSVAREFLAGEDREVFIVMNLDSTSKINSIQTVAMGSLNMAHVQPREVFKSAILSSALQIIVAHNHPSGDPSPSDDDGRLTCRLLEYGALLGIKVLDHIIIGDNEYSHFEIREGKDNKREVCWLKDKFKGQTGAS